MSKLRDEIIWKIIEIEGGYVDDPSDSGGETKFGITEAVARANGYDGKMKDLGKNQAFVIYAKQYWHALHLDEIEGLSPLVAEEMADTAVNMGTGRAARFLQRSLNILNDRSSSYADLAVDGQIGPVTLRAFKHYLKIRGSDGEKVIFNMLNALQGTAYIELAERREKDRKFIYGWYKNRVGMA